MTFLPAPTNFIHTPDAAREDSLNITERRTTSPSFATCESG
jgi:hypothetical protein